MNNKITVTLSIFMTFYLIGCSSYSVPSESKVLVKKEDLSSYNPRNFSKDKNQKIVNQKKLKNEDQLIIKAIFLEEEHAYKQSNEFYELLYKETKKEEYLLKELSTAYLSGIISPNLNDLKAYVKKRPNNLQAQRMLLSFYLKDKKFNKAKEVGKNLTQLSKEAVDFELSANAYIFTGDYENALTYLQKAYEKTYNEDILLKIVAIDINYLKKIDNAIEILEEHRVKQGCSEKICLQLVGIYSEQHQTSKLIPIYKDLYNTTKKEIYTEKIIESYLIDKNTNAAIEYLEDEKSNFPMLYSLYMEQKSYLKANTLAKQLSKKTNDSKWYAEAAISDYESLTNKDDKERLKEVINNFKKAIALGEKNPVYLNYYGYTLIDKDIDVTKGLDIIKKSLAEEPGNTYFLDSLAWGYYKLDNCEKAYPAMKNVVEVEGLKEEEIIEHWNAIDSKCKKN